MNYKNAREYWMQNMANMNFETTTPNMPGEVVADDPVAEEVMIETSKPGTESEENAVTTPLFVPPSDSEKSELEHKDAEVVEDNELAHANGTKSPAVPPWGQKLPYPLSSQELFRLSLTVEAPDPARQQLGFLYEDQLKRECELLIPHPIPHFYTMGIWKALMLRRSNPNVFFCNAIDIVLTYYMNDITEENYYGL